jgi:hypothetical protein
VEPNASDHKKPLDDYELANRLSYFLWSTMPDDTLFSLAEQGQLKKPEVLKAQLERMIRDPRSSQFSKHFASQWFDLEAIRKVAVNPEFFEFEEITKDLFETETIQFVDYVFRNNLSIANFVDSDFAVLSPALAKHYGIQGVAGGSFAPVKRERTVNRVLRDGIASGRASRQACYHKMSSSPSPVRSAYSRRSHRSSTASSSSPHCS